VMYTIGVTMKISLELMTLLVRFYEL
jgi:hypothetical protein